VIKSPPITSLTQNFLPFVSFVCLWSIGVIEGLDYSQASHAIYPRTKKVGVRVVVRESELGWILKVVYHVKLQLSFYWQTKMERDMPRAWKKKFW